MNGWAGTWRSKRGQFINCLFWKTNMASNEENDDRNNLLIHNKRYDGAFSAKQLNAYTLNKLIVQGVFMTDRIEIALETTDDISMLEVNDNVEIVGTDKKYIVSDIQQVQDLRSSQFINCTQIKKYYITLRG